MASNGCVLAIFQTNCFAEPFEENFLIVADNARRNLYQISLDTCEAVPLLPCKPGNTIAVVYDELNHEVFWTDVTERSIGRYSLRSRLSVRQCTFISTDSKCLTSCGMSLRSLGSMLWICNHFPLSDRTM
jgi:hypothetical protein